MNKIEKKVWPEYFEKISNGKKTFELRARTEITSSDFVQCASNAVASIEQNLEAYQRYDERFCD